MKLYIIRHGETDLNAKGVLQGWLDMPLNQNGRELAAITGRAMKELRFDCCISSPLVRARETAEILLRESGNDVPVSIDDRICEMSFGAMEGKNLSEMGTPGTLFYLDPFRFIGFPGGEDFHDLCRRTQDFLKELIAKDDGKICLISTHGCAMRAMLNCLYENPADFWRGHAPYNCSVSIVAAESGTARILEEDKVYYDRSLIVDRYKQS